MRVNKVSNARFSLVQYGGVAFRMKSEMKKPTKNNIYMIIIWVWVEENIKKISRASNILMTEKDPIENLLTIKEKQEAYIVP